ncbi:MAG: ROK family protein [Pseudomonadota bacterium]
MAIADSPAPKRQWWRAISPPGVAPASAEAAIGIDFGGAMIEAAALDSKGRTITSISAPRPDSYDDALKIVTDLVAHIERELKAPASVGISVPGSLSPRTGVMRNANAIWLNGQNFRGDLSRELGRPVLLGNDSDCLALSEATDGAAKNARVAFAAFIGAGVGGGLVVSGRLVPGGNGIGGEWGHVSLPWPSAKEAPGPKCWCGRCGCIETWVSEAALEEEHFQITGDRMSAGKIVEVSNRGDMRVAKTMETYVHRLGRALASICNIIDPDVIVLGGGMANANALYTQLPEVIREYVFSDVWESVIVKASWGAASSLRGAARLAHD